MKHHKAISRKPMAAQTSLATKSELIVGLTRRIIEFIFSRSGHNTL
jgi:hypothetical protein